MTTQALVRKLNREMSTLRKDVEVVKNLLLAEYRDPEGEYKKSFVTKMLKRMSFRGPVYRFNTKEAFLSHVRSIT